MEGKRSCSRTGIIHDLCQFIRRKQELSGQQMKVDGSRQPISPGQSRPRGAAHSLRWVSRQRIFILYQLNHFSALVSRGINSFKGRGLVSTLRIVAKRLFPVKRQPYTLLLYKDIDDQKKVRLPRVDPQASIVIPVHNQLDYTLRCLYSLTQSGDATAFEVIVIDDASSDASAAILPGIEGLRYRRNAENFGFIGSCNAGAALAHSEFLVFLNNDTVVQPGWLDALLKTFASHPDTGLAGSKLIYPDGRLQEAGGIVFSDGSAANYGRNDDPTDPRYNFVREADYCSGAAIAIRRSLFADLGGFDPHYRPAYFEDTDIAMRVRQRGLKVRYQPASVVVHFEGASSGTDLRHGVKAYQTQNEKKFADRWGAVLASSQPMVDTADVTGMAATIAATHRAAWHVLIIDSYTPTPDRDSGSARMVELMTLLAEENCAVVFFCQNLSHDGHYTEALQQLGVEAWWRPWIKNVPAWLDKHGSRFDAIIVSRHYVLSPLLPILRELAPQAQIVFDSVDLHFLREQREADQAVDPMAMLTAARTRKAELNLVREVDRTWVVSSVERELLAQIEPSARVDVVSNIHGITADSPGFADRQDLLFVGSFRHPPNVDAACWLVEEILPLVRRELPTIRLHLVGADASESVLALARHPGVLFRGHLPELEGLLDGTRISLAPLRFGAGIKGKINHSLARGLPVVATSCAIEGMFLVDGEDVLSADSAELFASAIVRLYGDQQLWQRLRAAGIENTRRHFSRDAARNVIRPWLESLRSA